MGSIGSSCGSTGSTEVASAIWRSAAPTTSTSTRSAADELDFDRARRLVGRGLEGGRGLVEAEAVADQPLDRRPAGVDQLDRDVEVVAAVDDSVADREGRPQLPDHRPQQVDRDRLWKDADDRDRALDSAELPAEVDRVAVAADRLDDEVGAAAAGQCLQLADRLLALSPDHARRAELLGQGGLVVVARQDVDRPGAEGAGRDQRHQANRAGADDRDAGLRRQARPAQRVHADRERLDQRALLGRQAGRQREESGRPPHQLIGEATAAPRRRVPLRAVERLPLAAELAAAARRAQADRLDRDQVADAGRSLVARRQLEHLAGDFVPLGKRLRLGSPVVRVKVGAADAGGAHPDQRLVGARPRRGQVDDLDLPPAALQRRSHVANTTPMSDELEPLLATALAAVGAGARALRRRPTRAAAKGGDPINIVTDRDLASQRAIFGTIRRAFPEHSLIGEEDPDAPAVPPAGSTWTIDPLDGTSNFAHGLVPFGVSVGHARDGRPLVGAIALPAGGVLAWAVRGRGAFLRRAGRVSRLRVSERAALADALVLTGYGYARSGYPAWLRRFERAVAAAQSVRMTGAAVADQVALASGVADVV